MIPVFVLAEVGRAEEALVADLAVVRLVAAVRAQVLLQALRPRVHLVALRALVALLAVRLEVRAERAGDVLAADWTQLALALVLDADVFVQARARAEHALADVAHDVALARVNEDVRFERSPVDEATPTVLARLRAVVAVTVLHVTVAALLGAKLAAADAAREGAPGVDELDVHVELLQRVERLLAVQTREVLLARVRQHVRLQGVLERERLVTVRT